MALHFSKEEFKNRKLKTLKSMKEQNLNALLMFKQESMYWLTGYDTFGFVFFQSLILRDDGEIILLTRAPDLRQAQNTSNIKNIKIWEDKEGSSPSDILKDILIDLNLNGKNIGIEYDSYGLTGRNTLKLNNSLKDFGNLEDKSELISYLRVIKSNEEIVYVRKAAELADNALDAVWKTAKAGASEGKILAEMQKVVFEGGGDYPANDYIIGSGHNALLCRYQSEKRILDKQDQLSIEWAGTYKHYHSAMFRTIPIGKAHENHFKMYDACVDALTNCEKKLIPESTVGEVFDIHANTLDNQLKNYENESVEINNQLATLSTELSTIESETPELTKQITSLNTDLENFINIKADLAMAAAAKHNIEIQEKVIAKVKNLENKSIISIEGTNVFRVVDNDSLLDDKGKFEIPKGTLTLNGTVYTAGAVQPEKLFSFSRINTDEEINEQMVSMQEQFSSGEINEEELRAQRETLSEKRKSLNIEFSELAAAQLGQSGKLTGGKQDYNQSTLGSWVLVNAVTGEQMTNPLSGHSGGIVCTGDVCGQGGDLGKQAASFGGMFVLEGLAGQDGNVSSICSGGGCKFDVETLRVVGADGKIAGQVFSEATGGGVYQKAFGSKDLNEIKKYGMTTQQRQHAIAFAKENNIDFDATKLVSEEDLNTQAAALAYAAETNMFVMDINKEAGAYTKYKTDDFKDIALTYGGKEIQAAAKEASEAATEVASAAKEATEAAKEVAKEATKTVEKVFLTGNDLAELSKLANDAHGSWVLVDAATGKQMADPLTGHVGGHAGYANMMSATGDFGKAAAKFGGVYVLENLAHESGNVSSRCASGDCEFNIGN